jgi:hypothetical protein
LGIKTILFGLLVVFTLLLFIRDFSFVSQLLAHPWKIIP